mgnify:CR=1 FL=1|jgi:hypothetical protein
MADTDFNLEDIYSAQEQELLDDRKRILEEIYKINNLEASHEYSEIDMKRYQYYYLGWSLASVMVILVTLKYYK